MVWKPGETFTIQLIRENIQRDQTLNKKSSNSHEIVYFFWYNLYNLKPLFIAVKQQDLINSPPFHLQTRDFMNQGLQTEGWPSVGMGSRAGRFFQKPWIFGGRKTSVFPLDLVPHLSIFGRQLKYFGAFLGTWIPRSWSNLRQSSSRSNSFNACGSRGATRLLWDVTWVEMILAIKNRIQSKLTWGLDYLTWNCMFLLLGVLDNLGWCCPLSIET